MIRDNSGLFQQVFADYKPPEKDIVGKLSDAWGSFQEFRDNDPIFGANSKNPFQFDFLGVVGGPTAVARAMKADPGGYGRKLLDYLNEFGTQVRNRELPTQVRDPISGAPVRGVYTSDVFDSPLTRAAYDDIGTLFMPYFRQSPVTGRQQAVPVLDLGMPKINAQAVANARDEFEAGRIIPLSRISMWEEAEKLYPGLGDRIGVMLDPTKGHKIGSASFSYSPQSAGGVLRFRNPGIFDDLGEMGKGVNHELTHGITSSEGMSSGTSPVMFANDRPLGVSFLDPKMLYHGAIDETFARAGETAQKGSLLAELQKQLPYMPQLEEWLGITNPLFVPEQFASAGGLNLWQQAASHFGTPHEILMQGVR